jgi:sulfur carrier protein
MTDSRTPQSITINGEPASISAGTTVLTLVAEQIGREITPAGLATDGSRLGIAVAVGDDVVPRSRWVSHELQNSDAVEIVTAVQGG